MVQICPCMIPYLAIYGAPYIHIWYHVWPCMEPYMAMYGARHSYVLHYVRPPYKVPYVAIYGTIYGYIWSMYGHIYNIWRIQVTRTSCGLENDEAVVRQL